MADSPGAPCVLVVEDERALRQLMLRVLLEAGCSAVCAADGREALALLEREPGVFDLVLTGIVMPRLDGVDLYRTLRRRGLTVPVLFVSGYTGVELAGELDRDPRARFLPKPWTLDELQWAVRDMLHRDPFELTSRR